MPDWAVSSRWLFSIYLTTTFNDTLLIWLPLVAVTTTVEADEPAGEAAAGAFAAVTPLPPPPQEMMVAASESVNTDNRTRFDFPAALHKIPAIATAKTKGHAVNGEWFWAAADDAVIVTATGTLLEAADSAVAAGLIAQVVPDAAPEQVKVTFPVKPLAEVKAS